MFRGPLSTHNSVYITFTNLLGIETPIYNEKTEVQSS